VSDFWEIMSENRISLICFFQIPFTGSLFNHSSYPNVSYEVKHSEYTIHYRAAKPIKQGEELFIFYGHSVRFDGDPLPGLNDDDESVDDGWGGLGNLGEEEEIDSLDKFKAMSEEQLRERDTEIVGFEEPKFPFKKITEIIDPEDRELSTCASNSSFSLFPQNPLISW